MFVYNSISIKDFHKSYITKKLHKMLLLNQALKINRNFLVNYGLCHSRKKKIFVLNILQFSSMAFPVVIGNNRDMCVEYSIRAKFFPSLLYIA